MDPWSQISCRGSRVLINFLQWWFEGIDSPIQLESVKALRTLGYSIAVTGFKKRPRLDRAIEATPSLWMYFQQIVGTHKSLCRPWFVSTPRTEYMHVHMLELGAGSRHRQIGSQRESGKWTQISEYTHAYTYTNTHEFTYV